MKFQPLGFLILQDLLQSRREQEAQKRVDCIQNAYLNIQYESHVKSERVKCKAGEHSIESLKLSIQGENGCTIVAYSCISLHVKI